MKYLSRIIIQNIYSNYSIDLNQLFVCGISNGGFMAQRLAFELSEKIKVTEIKIKNGGHTWQGTNQYLPGKLVGNTNLDFNGCDAIWNFFKSLK